MRDSIASKAGLLLDHHWYSDLISSPLFMLTLSVAAFQLINIIYQRLNRFPLIHPTVVGAGLVAVLISVLDINYKTYFDGNHLLMFWLGPATVALAVPLYQQFHLIREMALPILLTLLLGAIFACFSAVAIAYLLGANIDTMLSLAPKSVTTPIAISIAEEIGGVTTLAAGTVAITAVVGITFTPIICKWLKIEDPRILGVCLGITSHGMGTARAFELNPTAGAFSSLAMCLTGALSAVFIPIIASHLQ